MTERLVDTPEGPARTTTTDPGSDPVGTLVLGHGAGGLRWTLDVLATRDAAVAAGWQVVLVDQPWRVAERRVGPRPAVLDTAWLPVLADVAGHRQGQGQHRGAGPLPFGQRGTDRVRTRTEAGAADMPAGAGDRVEHVVEGHGTGQPGRAPGGELGTSSFVRHSCPRYRTPVTGVCFGAAGPIAA